MRSPVQHSRKQALYNILENSPVFSWGTLGLYVGCIFYLHLSSHKCFVVARPPQHVCVCAFVHGFLYMHTYIFIFTHIQAQGIDTYVHIYIYTLESLYIYIYNIYTYSTYKRSY